MFVEDACGELSTLNMSETPVTPNSNPMCNTGVPPTELQTVHPTLRGTVPGATQRAAGGFRLRVACGHGLRVAAGPSVRVGGILAHEGSTDRRNYRAWLGVSVQ